MSAGILNPPVGHLRGEQKKIESGNLKADIVELESRNLETRFVFRYWYPLFWVGENGVFALGDFGAPRRVAPRKTSSVPRMVAFFRVFQSTLQRV
jgi:hypothetical protein